MVRQFPFTALVGQQSLKMALILNAVDPRVGGVLIRGQRGTAKTTAARSLAALLPFIRVVADCRFGCDPSASSTWCSECCQRVGASQEHPPVDIRPVPFVNLPVSATEDRVVGTLDFEQAIQQGVRAFQPGVLAAVNRGLLYIDEVNLLDDHVVDVLLDSAAMGVNIVEREGISFSHPARFILVGTMNPEEGDLRPQLIDRFGLSVEVHTINDLQQRVRIIERVLAFERDPEEFAARWQQKELALSKKITSGRSRIPFVTHTDHNLLEIAELTAAFEVDGHRADLCVLKAARAHAAFEGRLEVTTEDIAQAAELALPHRIRRGPYHRQADSPENLHSDIHRLLRMPAPPTISELAEQANAQLAELTDENAEETGPWRTFRTGLG